jgi:hypothetical protein
MDGATLERAEKLLQAPENRGRLDKDGVIPAALASLTR